MNFNQKYWKERQLPLLQERLISELDELKNNRLEIDLKEYEHRKSKIENPEKDGNSLVGSKIFQIGHEIDTAYMLSENGKVILPKEVVRSKTQRTTIDINYLSKYEIECSCGDHGSLENVKKYNREGHYLQTNGELFDTEDKKIMYNRFIGSIEAKIHQYNNKFIPQEVIDTDTCFIISLANKSITGPTGISIYENGCEMLEVLFEVNIKHKIEKLSLNNSYEKASWRTNEIFSIQKATTLFLQ